MTTEAPTSRRPGGITLVVVLAYVASLFIILFLLFGSKSAAFFAGE